ncbi:Disease resistance protein [Glycine max]|nr:Disease resistance protein [Glycine max]
MESVLSPIVERTFNFAVDPIIRQLAYILRCRQNVDELLTSFESLELEKESIDRRCDQAQNNLQNIEAKVKEWSRKVDELKTELEKFRNDEGHTKTGLSNVLFLFPYFWNRHRLGRQAKKMAEIVKNLIDESAKFNDVSYTDNLTSNDFTLSNPGYMGFASRHSTVEKIIAKLEDSSVRMIGLHGSGGMGKTTLIKAIAKKAMEKKLFNVVAVSEITANPNPQKIQEDIASALRLRLEGEGENSRAHRLMTRLKQEKENTLIILDDLWDRLDLNKLGIPLDGDVDDNDLNTKTSNAKQGPKEATKEKSLGDYMGCKILLTSRDKNVLTDKMEVKSTFYVEELDDDDALRLFRKEARIQGEMSEWKQEIVKKYCAGLPMAIVTVGRALREKSDSEWEKLKNQDLVGVQNSMEISVKMSYDRLENEELKSIFFLCAQMGHQPLIMDLVKYCFGLGILKGVYSLGEARGRISTSIQQLKNSGLVLDGSSSIHFNMHDLVRDAALSIAQKEQNVFTLRDGKLDDWPELERCTSISICNSDIIDELPEEINCPQLKFFQIDSDASSLKIPDSFFKGMKKLKVLMLTGIQLSSLPSSIESLSDLRLLCLERCTLDHNLSIIGKLKKLRILSFSGSRIENLPGELKDLDKLQLLDISNCSVVKRIPPKLMSRLTSLEELYVRKSFIEVSVEGERNHCQISFLSELKHLHQLHVVDLSIPCAQFFPKELFFDKLNDYKIEIGNFKTLSVGDFRMPNKYEKFKSLALELKDDTDNIHSQKGIKLLFKTVENLLLGELNGVQDVINELNLDGFPHLKHLSIINNPSIKYIINSKDLFYPQDVFPKLESLCLYELRKIEMIYFSSGTEMICFSPFTDCSFTKLKTIKVEKCDQLKNLFSFCMVKLLASLETIGVSNCGSLEEIIKIPDNSDKIEFLKLMSLSLESLSSFTSFYTTVEGSSTNRDQIQITVMTPPLFGELVEIPNLENLNLISMNKIQKIWSDQPPSNFCFQNLIKLVVKDCHNLRYLCSLSVASNLRKLKGLFVSKCKMMEKIFSTEGNSADKVYVFPKLEEIHLNEMDELTDIWQAEVSADSFSSVTSVNIDSCNKLDKIFPSHMEGWFASLNSLKVYSCQSVKVIFEIKDSQQADASGGIDTNLQVVDVCGLPKLKQVWSRDPGGILNFKKLQSIKVFYCERLRNVFPASVAKDVLKLEYMSVRRCDGIVEIVACEDGSETNIEQLVFPELTYMALYDLRSIQHFYRGRHPIECPKLKKLEVRECNKKLKTFGTGERSNEEDEAVMSAEKCEFKFPSLEVLIVRECRMMERFTEGGARAAKLQNIVTANEEGKEEAKWQWEGDLNATIQKGFNKLLESASTESSLSLIDSPLQVIWLDSRWIPKSCFSKLNSLTVDGCQFLTDVVIPFYLLPLLTNLEELKVRKCGSVKSIFDVKTTTGLGAAAFPRPLPFSLKKLTLERLPKLENVWNEDPHGILTMQLLQHVIVAEDNADPREANLELTFPCPCVRSLKLQGLPKFKYFYYCSLQCDMFQTPTEDEMPTSNLQCLSLGEKGLEMIKRGEFQRNFLHKLQVLTLCFHIGSNVFPYEILQLAPNIEKLVVCDGSFKEIFCFDSLNVDEAGLLLQLKVLCLDSLPELVSIGLENSSIQPLLGNLETLEVIGCSSLKGLVPSTVSFSNLTYLQVQECNSLLYFFTSSTARSLTRLKRMEIKWCGSIEEVVSKEGGESHEDEIIFPQLNCLKLEGLRKLRSFYKGSLLSFPSLEELSVIYCEWMETLCPGTLKADKLVQVQLKWGEDAIKLENDLNSTMREAFWKKLWHSARRPWESVLNLKDSPVQEIWLRLHSLHIPPHFRFTYLDTLIVDGCHFLSDAVLPLSLLPLLPNLETLKVRNCDFVKIIFDVTTMEPLPFALKTLILERLPNLENVWNSNVELTFPQVKSLALCDLPKLKYDILKPFTHLEPHALNQVCFQKLTPNIEHLTLGQHELNMILSGEFQGNHLNELKVLALFFHFESDVFLQRVPNIEKLEVCDGSFKEIFCFDSLNVDEDGLVSQLKVICPDSLPELVSIGPENSGIVPFLRNLETLQVISCLSSINLVPCTVSFSNLTYLKVKSCKSLLYLFTSSTARSLGQLKTMEIGWCDSIEEIVSSTEEGDESDENEIIFQQLNCLKLEVLRKLRRFYKGSLSFPSLEEFTVLYCERMESLCAGTIKTDKLLLVNLVAPLLNFGYDIPLETDLNSAMQNR